MSNKKGTQIAHKNHSKCSKGYLPLIKLNTNKLHTPQDPLVLAAGALPLWCEYLVINFPMLFPFETRQTFFKATAFGCSR